MKKLIAFELEEKIINLAKERAMAEGMTFGELIQTAIVYHLSVSSLERDRRIKAYKLFCEQPFKISRRQFKEIIEER